ncbi:MAG: hypothetical protein WAO69_03910 [Aestuariivita sp.]|uniref:hypothetical protein n=1 Tax=Aestuariivita sp. TaxID=1872407 RepID=UPI003BB100C4
MTQGFAQQLLVFAAIFLCFQLGFDLLQGLSITPGVFLSRLGTTIIATAIYGLLSWWLRKRSNREE